MLTIVQRSSAAFRAPTAGPVSVAVSIVDEHGDDVPMDGWQPGTVAGDLPATVTVHPADPEDPDSRDHLILQTTDALPADLRPGIHELLASVVDDAGASHQLEPVRLVVEDPAGWQTLASARAAWADAPAGDAILFELLDAARLQCESYAPLDVPDDGSAPTVPAGHRQAQLHVARAIWQRARNGNEDTLGVDAYAVRVYIDDVDVRRLLRPRRVRGGIA